MNPDVAPTRFATLTGNLPGAIATTVLQGPQAAMILCQLFEPRAKLAPQRWRFNQIYYGNWKWDREPSGSDQDVPPSATGEDLVICRTDHDCFEIQSHAGYAVHVVASSLMWAGAQPVHAVDYARRSINRWTQQVEQALTRASTQRCSLELLRQWWLWQEWGPKFDRSVGQGDGEPAVVDIARQCLAWGSYSKHLTVPQQVVFCGDPNVGKSSLINACLGYQRSIVDHQPGTTRDVVEQIAAIDGWPVIFSDTAGLRETRDPIEAAGIAKARRQIAAADCLVVVIEAVAWKDSGLSCAAANQAAEAACSRLGLNRRADVVVVNKADIVGDFEVPATWVMTSAVTGHGLSELLTVIGNQLVQTSPPNWLPLPVTPDMETWLRELVRIQRISAD